MVPAETNTTALAVNNITTKERPELSPVEGFSDGGWIGSGVMTGSVVMIGSKVIIGSVVTGGSVVGSVVTGGSGGSVVIRTGLPIKVMAGIAL